MTCQIIYYVELLLSQRCLTLFCPRTDSIDPSIRPFQGFNGQLAVSNGAWTSSTKVRSEDDNARKFKVVFFNVTVKILRRTVLLLHHQLSPNHKEAEKQSIKSDSGSNGRPGGEFKFPGLRGESGEPQENRDKTRSRRRAGVRIFAAAALRARGN